MTTSYWDQRNALVDRARSAGNGAPCTTEENGLAFSRWLTSDAGLAYCAALDALRAFDDASGVAPIL